MGFDFFKKKKGRGKGSSGYGDELQFDDIETSGEFLSGPEDASGLRHPPPPQHPPAPPPQPVYQRPPKPSAPASSTLDDDITIINRPPVVRPPKVQATPAPPGQPASPGPPQPPPRNVTPPMPGVPSSQNELAPDEVTQVLNKPVGIAAVVAWLVVVDGPMRGEDFRLPAGTVRMGLNPDCEVTLSGDTFISSQHAEISFRNGVYWVRDLDSTNGLFVNETRTTEVALNDGDKIKAGKTLLVYKSLTL